MNTKVNTKYKDYTQRQRLDMIRNGNSDVYSAEKDNNAHLKALRESLGLSTKDIDEWDKTVDMAAESPATSAIKAVTPKFQSTRAGSVSSAYNIERKQLAADYNIQKKKAKEQAEKDVEHLIEYLVNNGYASDGKTALEGEKEIRDELKVLLASLKAEYNKAVSSTRNKYVSMMNKVIKA